MFKITYGVGIAGYTFFVLAFFGFPAMFMIKPETWLDIAILLLFYGVYFGVITKDIADMCTDRMASTIGKRSKLCHDPYKQNLILNFLTLCLK